MTVPEYVLSFHMRDKSHHATFLAYDNGNVSWYYTNSNNHVIGGTSTDKVRKHDLEYPEELHERCRQMLVDACMNDPEIIAQWDI